MDQNSSTPRLWLRPALVCLIACALLIGLIRAACFQTDYYDDLRGWIGQGCEGIIHRPCLLGILPGATTVQQAQNFLSGYINGEVVALQSDSAFFAPARHHIRGTYLTPIRGTTLVDEVHLRTDIPCGEAYVALDRPDQLWIADGNLVMRYGYMRLSCDIPDHLNRARPLDDVFSRFAVLSATVRLPDAETTFATMGQFVEVLVRSERGEMER